MKFFPNTATAAVLAAGVLGSKNSMLTPERAADDVNGGELTNILWNLNKIAADNGGNRVSGLPGFKASVDFVLDRTQNRFGDHMDTFIQNFTHDFHATNQISLTGPDTKKVHVETLDYNSATPLPHGITAPLIDTPVDDARGSACFVHQWKGINATGKIALIKRGICDIAEKVRLAKEHGAVAVIMYSQIPVFIKSGTLQSKNVDKLIPVGLVHLDTGEDWSQRLASGEELQVTFLVDAVAGKRASWNIISETKEGDPNNVVMLGAHLDSVQSSPGINDNGSGVAALLEIMRVFTQYTGFKNKVRFAWWGAEERGLAGSIHYTSRLSSAQANKIRFYFNYDMIGTLQPRFEVYADDDAHKAGGSILFDYLKSKGLKPFYG